MVWFGLNSNGIRASLVISVSLLILTLTSNFGHFEWFSKSKCNVLNESVQNLTTKGLTLLKGSVTQNITVNGLGTNNFTESNAGSRNSSSPPSTNGSVENATTKGLALNREPIITQNITVHGLETKNFTESNVGSKNRSSPPSTKNHADHKQLLDGFDKGSCLSRFESYLYRKASPHEPSPYLISKLRSYENLHKRCGPHTRFYKRTMVNLNRFNSNVITTGSCKYIIWTAANGLGNRMVSMAASFLYAILTNRVLLMEFHDDMVDLFCEPFPNSSWILPKSKDFPFKGHLVETYQNVLRRDRENYSKDMLLLPLVIHLKIQHTSDDHEKFFSCDHSQKLLLEVPILILSSDQYFVPSLFMVPSFSQELRKMFPNTDTVFHHLGHYLFLPSNHVWGQIKKFYQTYFGKADEKIGIQIRVFSPNLTPYQAIMNQVLSCTQKNKILPDLAAENSWKNQTLKKSVLVTSLYTEYGENLRIMYLNKPTVTGEIIEVYQPSHEEHQKFGNNLHNMKALTEIYLLSFCDVLVTSSLSTFGYVAQSLGGVKPWVLYKLHGNYVLNSPCTQDVSMEPCFHMPPKVDCMGKPIDDDDDDIGTTFPYMKRCVDYRWGLKLVNDLH